MVCATDTTDLGISTPSLSRPSTNNFTTSYLPIYGKREPVDQRPRVAVSTTVAGRRELEQHGRQSRASARADERNAGPRGALLGL